MKQYLSKLYRKMPEKERKGKV